MRLVWKRVHTTQPSSPCPFYPSSPQPAGARVVDIASIQREICQSAVDGHFGRVGSGACCESRWRENRDIRAAGHPGAGSLPEDNRLAVGYHICVRGVVSESVLYPRKSPKLGRLVGGYLTPGEAVADSTIDW